MPHYDSITKIRLCHSLIKNGVSPEKIPDQLGIHRATVYRWIQGIKLKGINKFIRDYKNAKKGRKQPRKTATLVKVRVYKIRDEYKQCCGEKIQYLLNRDYQTSVSISTIYRILRKKYQLRSKWKKYSKRGFVKKGKKPREVLQTDSVDLGGLYAFTAIDTYTKEACVTIKQSLTALSGSFRDSETVRYFPAFSETLMSKKYVFPPAMIFLEAIASDCVFSIEKNYV